ncbi:unnamed protein product [Mesocestoides corti]|uniref:SOCS box domain-containing protein n=1 Tax=Mesocestoides corti TaxID=53468 RepID=A0A0R3UJS5_MESCO|nr:unnamed protein product [Mesocestoides corti]
MDIQSSNYSITSIQRLQKTGFDFDRLSGQIVCKLVSRNFGLGLKILVSCGIQLACVDRETGDTPLILLAAEGLCGPVRYLLAHLPVEHLLHANESKRSVLSLLLSRGHGDCGCLEALLLRLPLSVGIHPHESCNRIVLTVADILDRIKTSEMDRVAGVFKFWISTNLINLENTTEGKRETTDSAEDPRIKIQRRTIGVVVSDCLAGWKNTTVIRTSTFKCIQMLAKLHILGRLSTAFLESCRREIEVSQTLDRQKPLEPIQIKQLQQLQEGIVHLIDVFTPIPPLKTLTILRVRRQLQRAMLSASEESARDANCKAFFHHQIKELNLPMYLSQMILLQENVHFC